MGALGWMVALARSLVQNARRCGRCPICVVVTREQLAGVAYVSVPGLLGGEH